MLLKIYSSQLFLLNFIAGRPKVALLFWFFGDFSCGVSLYMLFVVYINTEIGKNRC